MDERRLDTIQSLGRPDDDEGVGVTGATPCSRIDAVRLVSSRSTASIVLADKGIRQA
jgi:hypothetical protein